MSKIFEKLLNFNKTRKFFKILDKNSYNLQKFHKILIFLLGIPHPLKKRGYEKFSIGILSFLMRYGGGEDESVL